MYFLGFDLMQKQSQQNNDIFKYLEISPANPPFRFKGDFYCLLQSTFSSGLVSIMAFHFIDTCRQSLK